MDQTRRRGGKAGSCRLGSSSGHCDPGRVSTHAMGSCHRARLCNLSKGPARARSPHSPATPWPPAACARLRSGHNPSRRLPSGRRAPVHSKFMHLGVQSLSLPRPPTSRVSLPLLAPPSQPIVIPTASCPKRRQSRDLHLFRHSHVVAGIPYVILEDHGRHVVWQDLVNPPAAGRGSRGAGRAGGVEEWGNTALHFTGGHRGGAAPA
jgi:hypothetical protein